MEFKPKNLIPIPILVIGRPIACLADGREIPSSDHRILGYSHGFPLEVPPPPYFFERLRDRMTVSNRDCEKQAKNWRRTIGLRVLEMQGQMTCLLAVSDALTLQEPPPHTNFRTFLQTIFYAIPPAIWRGDVLRVLSTVERLRIEEAGKPLKPFQWNEEFDTESNLTPSQAEARSATLESLFRGNLICLNGTGVTLAEFVNWTASVIDGLPNALRWRLTFSFGQWHHEQSDEEIVIRHSLSAVSNFDVFSPKQWDDRSARHCRSELQTNAPILEDDSSSWDQYSVELSWDKALSRWNRDLERRKRGSLRSRCSKLFDSYKSRAGKLLRKQSEKETPPHRIADSGVVEARSEISSPQKRKFGVGILTDKDFFPKVFGQRISVLLLGPTSWAVDDLIHKFSDGVRAKASGFSNQGIMLEVETSKKVAVATKPSLRTKVFCEIRSRDSGKHFLNVDLVTPTVGSMDISCPDKTSGVPKLVESADSIIYFVNPGAPEAGRNFFNHFTRLLTFGHCRAERVVFACFNDGASTSQEKSETKENARNELIDLFQKNVLRSSLGIARRVFPHAEFWVSSLTSEDKATGLLDVFTEQVISAFMCGIGFSLPTCQRISD